VHTPNIAVMLWSVTPSLWVFSCSVLSDRSERVSFSQRPNLFFLLTAALALGRQRKYYGLLISRDLWRGEQRGVRHRVVIIRGYQKESLAVGLGRDGFGQGASGRLWALGVQSPSIPLLRRSIGWIFRLNVAPRPLTWTFPATKKVAMSWWRWGRTERMSGCGLRRPKVRQIEPRTLRHRTRCHSKCALLVKNICCPQEQTADWNCRYFAREVPWGCRPKPWQWGHFIVLDV